MLLNGATKCTCSNMQECHSEARGCSIILGSETRGCDAVLSYSAPAGAMGCGDPDRCIRTRGCGIVLS